MSSTFGESSPLLTAARNWFYEFTRGPKFAAIITVPWTSLYCFSMTEKDDVLRKLPTEDSHITFSEIGIYLSIGSMTAQIIINDHFHISKR